MSVQSVELLPGPPIFLFVSFLASSFPQTLKVKSVNKPNHEARIREGSKMSKWYQLTTNYEPPPIDRKTPRMLQVNIHRLRCGYKCTWEIINPVVNRSCTYCQEPVGLEKQSLLHYLLECEVTQTLRNKLNVPYLSATHGNAFSTACYLVREAQRTEVFQTLVKTISEFPPPR